MNYSTLKYHFLKINKDKTEVILEKEKKDTKSLLDSKGLKVKVVKNLDVHLDNHLNFNCNIKTTTKSAFYHLRNIAKCRYFMAKEDLEKLKHAFISSRLDYCNGLFTGLPKKWLVKSLHWLPVHHRIQFKTLLLVYKSLNRLGPELDLELTCFRNTVHLGL